RLRDERAAQALGDGGPEDGAVGVAGLLAEEDELRILALQRLREHGARRDEVGAFGRLVRDEQDAVGAHRERLPQRLERPRRPERDDDDLRVRDPLLDPERLLDGVHVEGVEADLSRAVEALRLRVDPPARAGFGHDLRADGDLHQRASLAGRPVRLLETVLASRAVTGRATLVLGAALLVTGAAAAHGARSAPRIVFPVVGSASYYDDFGEPRGTG